MGRKRILVDMDGTSFDIDVAFRTRLMKMYPHIRPLQTEEMTDYHMENLYSPEVREALHDVWVSPGLFALAPPIPGAIEAIRELARNHYVAICSTPRWDNPTCVDDKRKAIAKYLGEEWLKQKRVFLVDDKTGILGDYLIDDKPMIKGEWTEKPFWEHIIYDQPWNRNVNGKRRLTWQNWKSVLTELV